MTMSGTYVTDVPLKGSAEKHYKRWRSETSLFPVAVCHHYVQGVFIRKGGWGAPGTIKLWDYTIDGNVEELIERTEMDDENMAVTTNGLEGHVMEQLKVFQVTSQFIPMSEEGCVCKVTMVWEKRNEDCPGPINYMQFAEKVIADLDEYIFQNQA